jgi:hypothetical protein
MLLGIMAVILSSVIALWINDYTPWGGSELIEQDV